MSILAKFSTDSIQSPVASLEQARLLLQNAEQLCQARLKEKRSKLALKLKLLKSKAKQQAKSHAKQTVELQRLQDFIQLSRKLDLRFKQLEIEYADLLQLLCEKVIAESIADCHTGLLSKIRQVTAGLSKNQDFLISVNPAHYQHFAVELGESNLKADSAIEAGNAIISTALGQIIINWRNQLQALLTILKTQVLTAALGEIK